MGLFSKKEIITLDSLRSRCVHHITYVGMERGDLMTAVAMTLASTGLRVALIDNSLSHDIFYTQRPEGDKSDIVIKGTLHVYKNRFLDPTVNLDEVNPDSGMPKNDYGYDIVIEYNGIRKCPINDADYLVVAVSPVKQDISAVQRVLGLSYRTRMVLYRDYDGNYSVTDMCHDIKIHDRSLISLVKRDLKELSAYEAYTRSTKRNLIKGFKGTYTCYEAILNDVLKLPSSQLAKIIRKGARLS